MYSIIVGEAYSPDPSFLRRAATAAESAAKPVPNRTTVTGSGIGTGPDGGGVGVGVAGGNVTMTGGVFVGGGVSVGETDVLVGVGVGVSVDGTTVSVGVGDGGSVGVSVISAGASCAETKPVAVQLGIEIIASNNRIVAKTMNCVVDVCFIASFLLKVYDK